MSRASLFAAAVLLAAGCGAPPAPPEPPPEPVFDEPIVEIIPRKKKPDADADDAPPPPPKHVAVSALTGKIRLPEDGGRWPWKLAPAPPRVEGKGVTVKSAEGRSFLAVSPESGRFVYSQTVSKRDAKNTESHVTRVVLGDVTAGKVLAEWELKDYLIPLDVSPDGTRVALRSMWPDAKLTVLTVSPEFDLARRTIVAHDRIVLNPNAANPNDKELHVVWAGFLGTDRLASAAHGGQVRVFNAATLAKIGTLDGTPELIPTTSPDRKKLVAHAGGRVVLLDPAECQPVGTRPLPLPSGPKKLAVSPDGATLACAREGRVRFLSLTRGEVWDQMIPRLGGPGEMQNHFTWAGPNFLAAGRYLYDPAVPYAVWSTAHGSDAEAYTSRQLWAAVHPPGPFPKRGEARPVVVRPFDHVPPDLAGVVAAGKARPNIYTLAPWSKVKADVSKLPADKQTAVRADLEARLRDVGYVVDGAATTVLAAALDPAVTKNTPYANLTNVPYTHQPLRVQLRHGGKVVWEQVRVKEAPFSIFLPGGTTLAQKVAQEGYGRPDYEAIRTMPVPPDVPGPGFPQDGFGRTTLAADGARFQPGR